MTTSVGNSGAAAARVASCKALDDAEVIRRVTAGDRALFEVLMRRHNGRVYRAIRAVLRDEAEVEDAMQQTYLLAFSNLGSFAQASSFATWLTRIAINEALGRVRRRPRLTAVRSLDDAEEEAVTAAGDTPEEGAAAAESVRLLERCIDGLPEAYRTVVVLRDVEQQSTAEVAEVLGISEEAVRIRLLRARRALRTAFLAEADRGAAAAFPFHAPRCDRIVQRVLTALRLA